VPSLRQQLTPSNRFAHEVQASLNISTLALGAICFILSIVVVHETRRVPLAFAIGMMTMAMVCLNLGMASSKRKADGRLGFKNYTSAAITIARTSPSYSQKNQFALTRLRLKGQAAPTLAACP
jgi:hypothetical protein